MASLVSTVLLFCLAAAGTNAYGFWQCTVTHTQYLALPEIWNCPMSENCCLTKPMLTTTGCCKDMVNEQIFVAQAGYKACTPIHMRTYYCPLSRDCCTVAKSGGGNDTGCCISQVAADSTLAPKEANQYVPGFQEEREATSKTDQPKIHKRLSTSTIVIIAMIPVIFCVVTVVAIAYYIQMKKTRDMRRVRGLRRAQLQAAALGIPVHGTESEGSVSFEANGIAPPSYWETVREEATPSPRSSVASVPAVQPSHRSPATGNIQYSRLTNEDDK